MCRCVAKFHKFRHTTTAYSKRFSYLYLQQFWSEHVELIKFEPLFYVRFAAIKNGTFVENVIVIAAQEFYTNKNED